MPAAVDPRFPLGTSPRAEGARGDEEKEEMGTIRLVRTTKPTERYDALAVQQPSIESWP